jgi:hypothetical protein
MTLVVGMVFEGGAVVAADTRELHARGSVPVDGVGKLAVASWGLVSGGGDAAGYCRGSTEMVLSFEPAGPARPSAVPDRHLDAQRSRDLPG